MPIALQIMNSLTTVNATYLCETVDSKTYPIFVLFGLRKHFQGITTATLIFAQFFQGRNQHFFVEVTIFFLRLINTCFVEVTNFFLSKSEIFAMKGEVEKKNNKSFQKKTIHF